MSPRRYPPGDGLAQRLHRREIPEDLHGPDDIATGVPDQRRGHTDRDLLSRSTDDDGGMIVNRFPRLERPLQGTIGLAGAGAEDVEAELVDRLREGETRNFLRGPVEEGIDPALEIHREDAVRHALQDRAAGKAVASDFARGQSLSGHIILLAVLSDHCYPRSSRSSGSGFVRSRTGTIDFPISFHLLKRHERVAPRHHPLPAFSKASAGLQREALS